MMVWAILLGGPLVLPIALMVRSDMPPVLDELLLIVGALTLFLAICATEAVGDGVRRRAAD